MAFAYLNPQGRIWQANGLNYLLFSQDLSQEEGLCSLKSPDFSSFQKQRLTEKLPTSEDSLSRKVNGHSSQKSPVSIHSKYAHAAIIDQDISQFPAQRLSGHENTRPHGAPKAATWKASPPESWPQLWQQQLQQTKKALFAWTYMDLGADLFAGAKGQDDTADPVLARRRLRSQCLRRLIADLSHPVGTHTFWPVALPDADRQTYLPNIDSFWSGLDKLGCRGVIFMGKKAAQAAMGTDDLKPLSHLFKFGKLVWILWEPDEIARNPKVYSTVLPFLRRSLGQFIRI